MNENLTEILTFGVVFVLSMFKQPLTIVFISAGIVYYLLKIEQKKEFKYGHIQG